MRSIPGTRRHRSAQEAVVLLTAVLLGMAAATSSQEAVAPIVSGHTLRHRWVYLPTNFQVAANVDRLKGMRFRLGWWSVCCGRRK